MNTYPIIAAALLATCPLFADPSPSPVPAITIKAAAFGVGPNGKIFSFNSSSSGLGAHEKTTSLGVAVSQVPESVSAQLPLDPGVGLLITHVIKDGAAARAGLAENDVLAKLNDQVLIEPGQLRTLVQDKKEGDTVTLTYFHKGREQTATATLAKGEESDAFSITSSVDDPDLAQTIKEIINSKKGDIAKQAEAMAGKVQSGDLNSSVQGLTNMITSGLANATVSTRVMNSVTGEATQSDGSGTITISRKNGHDHLRATGKDDKVLYDGDIDTPDQKAKVPVDVMEKAKKLLDELKSTKEDSGPQSRNTRARNMGSVG